MAHLKHLLVYIFIYLMSTMIFAQKSWAAWITDYSGTLGDQKIGFALTTEDITSRYPMGKAKITNLNYFYTKYLQDIPLKLKEQSGRNISFEEYDARGKLVGTFNLTFAKQDPQKHFESKEALNGEILLGTWEQAESKKSYPVYLMSEQGVSGSEDGGRCDLDASSYQQLQKRIGKFYTAAVNNDVVTLQRDFNFTIPESLNWSKEVSKGVPHDLFCNYQGFTFGSGIVWFDANGDVIDN